MKITYIDLPVKKDWPLPFFLAMEEYVARHMDVNDAFFMWQSQPTVIVGRNQLLENEVNTCYCKEHGINIFRRKSGGGCVYSDLGNLMLSYVTQDEQVNMTFNRYVNMIALVLCKMGIDAKATGRNDILIENRKVSGNAFYHVKGHSIVHGTLLYDTCMEHMVNSITPSDTKMVSKGVKSVRQHIAVLKEHTHMGIEELKAFIRQNLCHEEITLDMEAIATIEKNMQEYLTDAFIYGKNPRYTTHINKRIENVGTFQVELELRNGIIKEVNLMGDYFLTGDIGTLLQGLKNIPYDASSIAAALPENMGDYILNMTREKMTELLLE